MKILLIDDDESLTSIYSAAFNKAGYETEIANSGHDGLGKAKAGSFDLILLDQVLPDISGNEVLKELKLTNETSNIPVVVLSNFGQEDLVKEAIANGATEYVFKYQVELSDVLGKVNGILKKEKTEMENNN
ncbi:response regulator [Patescibacteria group bacterium]|nr:response regulator [Patescibacteria group bacterium]